MFGEYSHRGDLFFFKKCVLMYFLTSLSPLSKRRCRTLELRSLRSGVGTCNVFKLGFGERKKRSGSLLSGSRDILFKNVQHLESLVSRHHLYSWAIDTSLTLQQCFVTFGFTMFKLKSPAPCSLSKTASLSIYFCLPHPVWISFVNLHLTTLVFQ